MNAEPLETTPLPAAVGRKPRLMLMGEFSAGKSTLANLLLGQGMSPVRATATQMPPIWYSYGERAAMHVDAAGVQADIPVGDLDQISPSDTQAVRVFLESDILEFCDLVDMPGTSDPNMSHELWEDLVSRVDAVIWCTPSTQAWRQSEAALWDQMPEDLHTRSLLLITRIDKLLTERDRKRVVTRVRREVDGRFRDVFPISLTRSIAAGEDDQALRESGASDFLEGLVGLVEELEEECAGEPSADDLFRVDPAEPAGNAGLSIVPPRQNVEDEPTGGDVVGAEPPATEDAPIAALWDDEDDADDESAAGDPGESPEPTLFDDDPGIAGDIGPRGAIAPRRVERDRTRRARTRPRSAPSVI